MYHVYMHMHLNKVLLAIIIIRVDGIIKPLLHHQAKHA